MSMDLHTAYPALSDLKRRAQRRIPHFVWEYLDSGTGMEATKRRNRQALDQIGFVPSALHGPIEPDLSVKLMGRTYPLPFGVAPVGMSGLIWPDAEHQLARAAAQAQMPFCLSTVATQSPEDMRPSLGADAWFQLYPPKDPDIRKDLLTRARMAGFSTLVLTVDVPVASRRERQMRSGLTNPPRLTPRLLTQVAMRPAWAIGMARRGLPTMRTLANYTQGPMKARASNAHVGYLLRTSPDWDYVRWLRDHWAGPFVVKGILRGKDAAELERIGVDSIWISNHAGRQFDAAPATIETLPEIRSACALPLLFDSGIESGLDILRAIARGADFVMLGRAFHFALAALGPRGPAHLVELLSEDLRANMGQLGLRELTHVRATPMIDLAKPAR